MTPGGSQKRMISSINNTSFKGIGLSSPNNTAEFSQHFSRVINQPV